MSKVDRKELRIIPALTETGRVKAQVRDSLKKMVEEKFFNDETGWEVANDNSMLYPLVNDDSGATVYARVQVTITAQDEFSTGKRKAKKEDAVDLSGLKI